MSDYLLLSSLWILPLIGMAIILALPKRSEPAIRLISLGFTTAAFLVSLPLLLLMHGSRGGPGGAVAH